MASPPEASLPLGSTAVRAVAEIGIEIELGLASTPEHETEADQHAQDTLEEVLALPARSSHPIPLVIPPFIVAGPG